VRALAATLLAVTIAGCAARTGEIRANGPAGAYVLKRTEDSCVVEAATGREVQGRFDLMINGSTCSAAVSSGPVGTAADTAQAVVESIF